MTSDQPRASGSTVKSRQIPLMSILIVLGGMFLALVVWTIPSAIMLINAGPLSALWQTETNRYAIVVLIIKIGSPLLIGLLLSACCWLWYLVRPFIVLPTGSQTVQRSTSLPMPSTSGKHESQRYPVESATSPVREGVRYPQPNPETPLPPTFDDIGPLEKNIWDDRKDTGKSVSSRAAVLQQRRQERLYKGRTAIAAASSSQASTHSDAAAKVSVKDGVAYEITINLLNKVSMTLTTARGIHHEVPLSLNSKRVQLLAYIAWLRGQPVNRDRMLEHIFGHGRDDEDATRDKLGEAFDSHKKLIRWDLREAINHLNEEAGVELIPPDLDIFSHKQRLYWLADVCRVVDLEAVEHYHQAIEDARKEGQLVDRVPDVVKSACDQLIGAYTGDFLDEQVTNYLDDFEPWPTSWARKPFTLFRDYYLQALWYAAEYELGMGQESADDQSETARREQRKHWGLAAQHYRTYAMYACKTRFDTKVTFGPEHGERVIMSERSLRRSLVLYGAIGATHQVDQVYSAYYKQMRSISARAWEPSSETLADLRSAKQQTNAYRFPKQVAPHESFLQVDTTQSA